MHNWRNSKIHWILELDLFCAQQVKWQKSLWPKTGEMTRGFVDLQTRAWYPIPGHKRTTGQSDSTSYFPLLLWTNYARFYCLLSWFKRELFKFILIFLKPFGKCWQWHSCRRTKQLSVRQSVLSACAEFCLLSKIDLTCTLNLPWSVTCLTAPHHCMSHAAPL